ncbi:MAG: amidohydrolase family protein [Deltaproteobacteria bacterium]
MIDAHQHFWQPARGGYDWFDVEGPSLRRPFLPADLAPHLAACGITKTVLVQADGTVAETDYILDLAAQTDFVAGVVGWLDFEDQLQINVLKRFLHAKKFKGLRPIIQAQPDTDWMLRDDIAWAYRAICDHGLTFDALGHPRHFANFRTLAERYPAMPMVLDHCLKPDIANETPDRFQNWANGMARLAEMPHVTCKFSALATEANSDWKIDTLRPYALHIIDVFGADRILWGSNWPVETLRGSYETVFQTARDLFSHLPETDQAKIFGLNAARFYRL